MGEAVRANWDVRVVVFLMRWFYNSDYKVQKVGTTEVR